MIEEVEEKKEEEAPPKEVEKEVEEEEKVPPVTPPAPSLGEDSGTADRLVIKLSMTIFKYFFSQFLHGKITKQLYTV